MNLRSIRRSAWSSYFNFISQALAGQSVEVEIAGPEIGDQIVGEWALLVGLSYDERSNVLFVYTPDRDLAISAPVDVVAEQGLRTSWISVRDASGTVRTLAFRQPLLLQSAGMHLLHC
jgi:hypothetical protein